MARHAVLKLKYGKEITVSIHDCCLLEGDRGTDTGRSKGGELHIMFVEPSGGRLISVVTHKLTVFYFFFLFTCKLGSKIPHCFVVF